jgi:tRNA pseudouridine55 synthase
MIDGLAVLDKPAGMTSHDVVARCRRVFGQKRVGHAGTLDPDATGVLLVGLGRATRLMQFMTGLEKSYRAEVVLGIATSTLDASGSVTGTWDMAGVGVDAARGAAATLTGTIQQVPPMVSAVKVGGRRLHQLAREGVEVERPPRTITVRRFDVVACDHGVLSVEIDCSSGTYVRVLAADLGARLGGGAHVRALRRTRVGPWAEADAVGLDAVSVEDVLAPAQALPWLDAVQVEGPVATSVGHGRVLDLSALAATGPGPWRILGPQGDLLAVYQSHPDGRAKPAVVLADAVA